MRWHRPERNISMSVTKACVGSSLCPQEWSPSASSVSAASSWCSFLPASLAIMNDIASMRTFSVRGTPCRKVTEQTWDFSMQCMSTSWRSMATANREVKASYRSPESGSYSFSPAMAQFPRSPLRPRLGSSVAFSSVRELECMVARLWVTRRSSSAVINGLATASASLRSAPARSCAAASAHSFVTNWHAPSTELTFSSMFIAMSSVEAELSGWLALRATCARGGVTAIGTGTRTGAAGAASRRRSSRRWRQPDPAAGVSSLGASPASAGISSAADASARLVTGPAASPLGASSEADTATSEAAAATSSLVSLARPSQSAWTEAAGPEAFSAPSSFCSAADITSLMVSPIDALGSSTAGTE
mmetsp:Transcript_1633/g.2817  ORF Transcript_1633/g.2817 Transcript_1633/m.2817 type:complete len:361 (+) Transcript_1633:788-1870(+)